MNDQTCENIETCSKEYKLLEIWQNYSYIHKKVTLKYRNFPPPRYVNIKNRKCPEL